MTLMLVQFLPSYLDHVELSQRGKIATARLASYGFSNHGAFAEISFLTESGKIIHQSVKTRHSMEYFVNLRIIYSIDRPEFWQPVTEFEDYSLRGAILFSLGEIILGTPLLAYFIAVCITLVKAFNDKQEVGFAQRFLIHFRKAG